MAAATGRALPRDHLRPAVIGPVGTSAQNHTLAVFAEHPRAAAPSRRFRRDLGELGGRGHRVDVCAGVPGDDVGADPRRRGAMVLDNAEVVRQLRERIDLLGADGAEAAYQARRTSRHGRPEPVLSHPRAARSAEEERERVAQREAISRALGAMPREEQMARTHVSSGRTRRTWTSTSPAGWPRSRLRPSSLYGTADTIFPAVDWPAFIKRCRTCATSPSRGKNIGVATEPAALDEIERFLGTLCAGRAQLPQQVQLVGMQAVLGQPAADSAVVAVISSRNAAIVSGRGRYRSGGQAVDVPVVRPRPADAIQDGSARSPVAM